MRTKRTVQIIKIGSHHFMNLFLKKGQMHFMPVEFFKRADANKERFDKYESAHNIDQLKSIWVENPKTGKVIHMSTEAGKDILLTKANIVQHGSTKGNIYSCIGIPENGQHQFKILDKRFSEFGDSVVLINNANEFFNRVESELMQMQIKYLIQWVNYFDPYAKAGQLSVFDKKIEHSYQSEIRIWIDITGNQAITIDIGSIEDLAVMFRIEDVINREAAKE